MAGPLNWMPRQINSIALSFPGRPCGFHGSPTGSDKRGYMTGSVAKGARFYIYDVLDENGLTIYVGKGSGRRANVSCRERSGHEFKIVAYFNSDREAYKQEVARIFEIKPALNLVRGGNGPTSPQRRICKDNWTRNLEKTGSKKYAAMLALSFKSLIDGSKIDRIREVAYG